VAQLTAQLCTAADAVRGSMCAHMRREEDAVFPLLQRHLCVAEQRAMVSCLLGNRQDQAQSMCQLMLYVT